MEPADAQSLFTGRGGSDVRLDVVAHAATVNGAGASLRRSRSELTARRLADGKAQPPVAASDLALGDLVEVTTGELVPADGEVIQGVATVDESAITGESAPVIREAGGDRSAVTAGTRVLSDRIVVKVTATQGNTFLDRMIALVEGAARRKTPNEIALGVLLAGRSLIFVLAVATIPAFARSTPTPRGTNLPNARGKAPDITSARGADLIPGTRGRGFASPQASPQYG